MNFDSHSNLIGRQDSLLYYFLCEHWICWSMSDISLTPEQVIWEKKNTKASIIYFLQNNRKLFSICEICSRRPWKNISINNVLKLHFIRSVWLCQPKKCMTYLISVFVCFCGFDYRIHKKSIQTKKNQSYVSINFAVT